MNALCGELGIPVGDFRFTDVAGLEYIIGSIAAPKNPWGSAIIERINMVIDNIKKPVALKYMEFLLPDSREEYLKVSSEVLEYFIGGAAEP